MIAFKQSSILVRLLIFLQAFLGLGALLGGLFFILAPDGSLLHMPLSVIKGSPFVDFLIPGWILFTLVGVYPMAVTYSLWKKPSWKWPDVINPFKLMHWSWAASLASGVIVILWICVEVIWVQFDWPHALYLVWGALIVLLTLLPPVRKTFIKGGPKE